MGFVSLMGGPVFWILCLLGIVAVLVFFNRLLSLHRAQLDSADFIRGVMNLLEKQNVDEAISVCDETSTPHARVVAAALRHRDGSARVLRETVDAAGRAEVSRLGRRLALLAIIAQTAPLLGLLGTILGMTRVVLALNTEALVTRADLLGGAVQSLTSAAAGLIVAAVVQVMYGVLHVRLERIVADLEAVATEILSALSVKREVPA